ncbi:hypothetical protein AKJ64_03060 [candidate division MSBL1 archaeon SCGC-AAA259E17]|uniref:Uncharacterized protein n=1 Tax=candidate division MSBL1 archaeon SCGC-AAA259E17 TaxID=1698263 RepID=A0A133UE40_9EURY|nr:hypothetical protein AKJ64_03060 [candidate division MSBL1 archaeon SCGC-AAA259E17]
MNEKGLLTGFLASKLALALAVALFLASTLAMYEVFEREAREKELKSVLDVVAGSLRKVDSLPGKIRLERKLPSVGCLYFLVLSGDNLEDRMVKIGIYAEENFHRTVILGGGVNGGTFQIRERNPYRITLKKFDGISVELD